MANTVFLSPGVYTKEQDFSVFASRIGITRLGLVGKFLKGPAFEPIKVTSADDFFLRFGATDPNYPATYVANSFLGQSNELTVTRILGQEGFTNSAAWMIVADSGDVLAVLRSKRNQISGDFYFDSEEEITIGATTGSLNSFILSATTGPLTAYTNSGITVSLDETRDDYIVKILGKDAAVVENHPYFYVESIFPHFVREATARGSVSGLSTSLVYDNTTRYTDYADSYTHAITPWIVSKVIGGEVKNLFKFHTIADGDSSNEEIKLSILNIDVNNRTFDVLVRRFTDTDATATQTALERWSNLTLDDSQPNFIGKSIGTTNEDFPSRSKFITVEMAEGFPMNTVPAGFRGYDVRSAGISGATSPQTYYKTSYLTGDTTFKTYLGISELAYTSYTTNQVSVKNAIKSIEKDLYSYQGATTSGMTTLKGFHLESGADSAYFVTGDFVSLTGYTNAAGTSVDRQKLKFTVVPAGGFDGWDKYKTYENLYEEFDVSEDDNVNSFKQGIDTFANSEVTDINLFATPGVDFSNNEDIVRYALDMIEDRADSLYVIDAPRISNSDEKGTPEDLISRLEATGIDTNYAATYWPWVQVADPNTGRYSYQSPTFMAIRAMAFTDNVAAPWWAPAGQNRGLAGSTVIKTDVRLTQGQKDVLYQGRVNPIVNNTQQGVVIWGQKTLQVQQSALDRINIRRLLLQVRRLIAAASLTLLFEQNDQTLRDQFLAKVEPILLQIQNQRGLNAFKVVMDESNNTAETIDRNTLVGKIQLQPTRTAEFIDLTFQVLPTGANFEDF